MNYYTTLNIAQNATDDELKKAYRKLAKQYHPDAGGDEAKFKEITEAYNILSDPEKRRMVDMGQDPNATNDYNFRSGFGDLRDIFSHFHRHASGQNYRTNKSVVTRLSLTLEEVLSGKEVDAEIGLPGNSKKDITIKIPAGVHDGHQVKFRGMGDASIAELPPGDLIVNVNVLPHNKFERRGNHLICEYTIPVWDAILGTTLTIETLEKETRNLKIKPGTQSETILKCAKYGLPDLNLSTRGDLYIKIIVDVPKELTREQIKLVSQLKDSFSTTNNEGIK